MRNEANYHLDQPLPSILFSSDSAAVASCLWHTAVVLLLEFELANSAVKDDHISSKIYYHASSACGIIETAKYSSSVLINAVQPLWICGRYLRTKSEKFTALELLGLIEQKSGWRTRWRFDALQRMWNLGLVRDHFM
jgi:hypothetical protein